MPELRRNLITGQWVIVAENRGGRPRDVAVQHVVADAADDCPFCAGREHLTPDETLAFRDPESAADGPGWRVRSVANKYPTLDESPAAAGLHEIIVESPRHLTSIAKLAVPELAEVLDFYRRRLAMLHDAGIYRHALLFKNASPAAGATLAHVHSQLMAEPLDDGLFGDRAVRFQTAVKQSGHCPLCRMIDDELADGRRIVAQSQAFVAFCPFASRFAYETWIVPREHAPHFHRIKPESLPDLAQLFHRALAAVERIVKLPAYNYIVHTAPFDTFAADHYHWHIEILPRIANLAGFEIGTGSFINTVSPERAAAALRADFT